MLLLGHARLSAEQEEEGGSQRFHSSLLSPGHLKGECGKKGDRH